MSSLPKLDNQAKKYVNLEKENAEAETASLEKTEAKVPLRTTNAGGAATTVIGPPHVPKGETEAGAVKETAIAKRAAASNVEEEAINNVIVEAAPSAVGVLMRSLNVKKDAKIDAVAEGRSAEVEGGDLTAPAAAPKTATVDTAETGRDPTLLTTATEAEDTTGEAALLKEEEETRRTKEDTTESSVEEVGLHTQHPDLILTLVRLASDHPPGLTSKKKANAKDARPALATTICLLETEVSAEKEDTAAPKSLATKGRILRRTSRSSLNNLPEKNSLQERSSQRTTKIAPTIEQVPNNLLPPSMESLSDGFCSDSLRLALTPSGCNTSIGPPLPNPMVARD